MVDPIGIKDFKFVRHVVGVSEHPDEIAFKIIFSDGSRTKADTSNLDPAKWKDHFIPENSVINNVQLMYDKNDMLLLGFIFSNKLGQKLLSTSWMSDPRY